MKTFVINGKEYRAKEFDFNLMCDLEDMGIVMETAMEKPTSTTRAYFSLCCGLGKEYAGKELEEHIKKGGNLSDVMIAMSEEMEKSDFFRALQQTAEEEVAENPKTKKEKQ